MEVLLFILNISTDENHKFFSDENYIFQFFTKVKQFENNAETRESDIIYLKKKLWII